MISHSLRLIPWRNILGRKDRKRSKKQQTSEDVTFDRMRWGWIVLAVGAVVTFIGAGGLGFKVQLQVRDRLGMLLKEHKKEEDSEQAVQN